MYTILLLTLLYTPNVQHEHHAHVHVVELNHIYNDITGEYNRTQFVFWDRNCQHVRDWITVSKSHLISNPLLITKDNDLYIITYEHIRISHTQYDVEVDNRDIFDRKFRRRIFHDYSTK